MRRAIGVMWVVLLIAACAGTPARTSAANHTEQAIHDVDAARFAAMTSNDFAALERLLADDLTYGHATGLVQTREQMLAAMRAGTMRYLAIKVENSKVSLQGDTAIVNGTVHFDAELKGAALAFDARYLEAYVFRDGRWQLLAWQSTRIPPATN